MFGTESITPQHVERGRQMRQIVETDVVRLGVSSDVAMRNLAEYLGVSLVAVRLGVAIANEADRCAA